MEVQPPLKAPQLLTVRSVAERLSVSTRTVNRMLSDGRLEKIKIGHNTRIPESAVIELISVGRSLS